MLLPSRLRLLHDTIEDTAVKQEEIESNFGAKVAELVDGVTKLGEVDFVELSPDMPEGPRQIISYENLRKLLVL